MPNNRQKIILLANGLGIVAFLLLPYYLFGNKLFVGGDDSRLFYSYPNAFLNSSFFSWFHFSSVGSYSPNQFLLPLLLIFSAIRFVINPPVFLNHLAFSLPIVIGFIYFQRLLLELVAVDQDYSIEVLIGSLIFVLSPIMIVGQLANFLYSAWLIALLPIILFYFVRYLKTNQFRFVVLNIFWCTLLSLALFSIPWLLGALVPLLIGLSAYSLFCGWREKANFLKKTIVFFGILIISQLFWLLPFAYGFIDLSQSNYGSQALSKDVVDTFTPTVLATSKGTLIYPLLNLFHRQIAFDFNWSLKTIFSTFYDRIMFLNIGFLAVIFGGLLTFKKSLQDDVKKIYLLFLTAFVVSLFLFTVNIGFLKQVFLWLGYVPGFAMFRNAFDKFALGYIFVYAIVLTLSLVSLSRFLKNIIWLRVFIIASLTLLVFLNAAPIKSIINKPLWTTENIYNTVNLPGEYLDFMEKVGKAVPYSSNILSIPFGTSSYTIIKASDSNSVYAGRSPVQSFSGVNDFSGNFSFPNDLSKLFNKLVLERRYVELKNLLSILNVNYIFETENVPSEVLGSYLFDSSVLTKQDQVFRDNLYGPEVLSSEGGNYKLFKVKFDKEDQASNSLISTVNTVYGLAQPTNEESSVFEKLLGLLDGKDVLVNKSLPDGITQSLYVVNPNQKIALPKGDYKLFSANKDVYSLNFEQASGLLMLQKNVGYTLNGQFYQPDKLMISPLKDDMLLEINRRLFDPLEIHNYAISAKEKIVFYNKIDDNLLPEPAEIINKWKREDCYSYDNRPSVYFDLAGKNKEQLSLQALAGHDACVLSRIDLQPHTTYQLEFDYQTDAQKLGINILNNELSVVTSPFQADKVWRHFSYGFDSADRTETILYLYSGRHPTKAQTFYKNIALRRYRPNKTISLDEVVKNVGPGLRINIPNDQGSFTLSAEEKEIADEYKFSSWNQGDCQAINNNKQAVLFTVFDDGQGLELKGVKGHNACVYKTFNINSNNAYRLEFDYKSSGTKELTLAYQFEGSGIEIYTLPLASSTWQHFSQFIEPKVGSSSVLVYLYSGVNQDNLATTQYKKIKISYLPKNNLDNFLVQDKPLAERPRSSEFKSVNSVEKLVHIGSASKPFMLLLNDAFHPGWKVYLKNNSAPSNCNQIQQYSSDSNQSIKLRQELDSPDFKPKYYTVLPKESFSTVAQKFGVDYSELLALNNQTASSSAQSDSRILIPPGQLIKQRAASLNQQIEAAKTTTTQCASQPQFFEGEDLSYLWRPPVFADSHLAVNNYANGWLIDPNFIKAHFPAGSYRENPDGSIDFDLVLYFQPQSYFYLGLIISGTTLLLCLSYLSFSYFLPRRRKEQTKEISS